MDLSKFVKENKLFDIGYRFVLWFLLGYALYSMSGAIEGPSGEIFRNAIKTPQSSSFTQLIGVIGIFIGGVALFIKELSIKSTKQCIFVYVLCKVSTDLVLAPFNIMSFGLGWGFYLYNNGDFKGQNLSILGILLPAYFAIMMFLALVSLMVRAEDGEYIYRKVYSEEIVLRGIVFFSLIGAPLCVIFFY